MDSCRVFGSTVARSRSDEWTVVLRRNIDEQGRAHRCSDREAWADRRTATAAVEHSWTRSCGRCTRARASPSPASVSSSSVARAARVARNPRTGETVKVKPTSVPAFRPGAQFKAVIAGGRSCRPQVRPSSAAQRRAATKALPRRQRRQERRRQEDRAKKAAPSQDHGGEEDCGQEGSGRRPRPRRRPSRRRWLRPRPRQEDRSQEGSGRRRTAAKKTVAKKVAPAKTAPRRHCSARRLRPRPRPPPRRPPPRRLGREARQVATAHHRTARAQTGRRPRGSAPSVLSVRQSLTVLRQRGSAFGRRQRTVDVVGGDESAAGQRQHPVLAFLFRAGGSVMPSLSAHQSSRSGMTPPWLQITCVPPSAAISRTRVRPASGSAV